MDHMQEAKSQRHDDVTKWKYFPRYWPIVRGIHRWPVNSPHKGQWRGALVFPLICTRINGWVNNGEAGDFIRHRPHYDVIVMESFDIKMSHGTFVNYVPTKTAKSTRIFKGARHYLMYLAYWNIVWQNAHEYGMKQTNMKRKPSW